MTERGTTIARRIAADLEDLRELERNHPHEVEAIVLHLVAHLRSWRPESVSPLGTLPPPTETIREPGMPDQARTTIARALAAAEQRRESAANAIVRFTVGGCVWHSDDVRKRRSELELAIADIAVATAALKALDELDAETGA